MFYSFMVNAVLLGTWKKEIMQPVRVSWWQRKSQWIFLRKQPQ